MPLIDAVKHVCDRLAGAGWGDYLRDTHGLEIRAADAAALEAQLLAPLAVDRAEPGFGDFHPDGNRGVEPGAPARSLLYHALASPAVHPPLAAGVNPPDAYPTLAELDAVENYVYALARLAPDAVPGDAVVAVFAYQYRTGPRSPHGLYADLAFSRTGVARVGTAAPRYDRARRSYWPVPDGAEGGGGGIAATGARYAAFLAVPRVPGAAVALRGGVRGLDAGREFLVPVHKLFDGPECLVGRDLAVTFAEHHQSEKLRRVHALPPARNGVPPLPGFRIGEPPFVRTSADDPEMVRLVREGASAVCEPARTGPLVRTATQRNAGTGREEVVRFAVPASKGAASRDRFWSSLDIVPLLPRVDGLQGREAPEYLNIRHRVDDPDPAAPVIVDINGLPDAEFAAAITGGGYEAAHFLDDTCDGCVVAAVDGLPGGAGLPGATFPAYSLVSAPDFLPLVDQFEVAAWAEAIGGAHLHFAQGGPSPLSAGRTAANPALTRPDTGAAAFPRSERGLTAVLGTVTTGPGAALQERPSPGAGDGSASFLPDAAANVFEPGWDISLGQDAAGVFHAAFGLGSPFPEDAKLCAALNSFWPAAAPDATRTFGDPRTAQPLLDDELGRHPGHRRVRAGEAAARTGWDGEVGPFFEELPGPAGGLFVNAADRFRSDYVANALAGRLEVGPLAAVTTAGMIARMEALRACVRRVAPPGDTVPATNLVLVEAEAVADWAGRPDRLVPTLAGPGLSYVFAELAGAGAPPPPPTGDLRRRRRRAARRITCQIALAGTKPVLLAFRDRDGAAAVAVPDP